MTTFPVGEHTHPGVLPQRQALESVGADTPGSRDETAHGHPATARGTGREHGRGETGGRGTRARRRHAETAPSGAGTAENGNGDVPPHDRAYSGGIGASRVFVLSKEGQPLMPCHPARARELLGKGRAVVARQVPFTIRLKDRTLAESEVDGVQLRIDPGSKGTGLALTDEKKQADRGGAIVTVRRGLVSIELLHRGDQISMCMRQRAGYRHRRRSANCRYRAPRSDNRTRPEGWLPPSLRHRVDTTVAQAIRLSTYAPITEIHVERVAFDTHAMSAGGPLTTTEYQQGTLMRHRSPRLPPRQMEPRLRLLRRHRRTPEHRTSPAPKSWGFPPHLEPRPRLRPLQPGQRQHARRGLPCRPARPPREDPSAGHDTAP